MADAGGRVLRTRAPRAQAYGEEVIEAEVEEPVRNKTAGTKRKPKAAENVVNPLPPPAPLQVLPVRVQLVPPPLPPAKKQKVKKETPGPKICLSTCKERFSLSDEQMSESGLDFEEKPNPHGHRFAKMKMYDSNEVKAYAEQVHEGGIEAALENRERRKQALADGKERRAEAARKVERDAAAARDEAEREEAQTRNMSVEELRVIKNALLQEQEVLRQQAQLAERQRLQQEQHAQQIRRQQEQELYYQHHPEERPQPRLPRAPAAHRPKPLPVLANACKGVNCRQQPSGACSKGCCGSCCGQFTNIRCQKHKN